MKYEIPFESMETVILEHTATIEAGSKKEAIDILTKIIDNGENPYLSGYSCGMGDIIEIIKTIYYRSIASEKDVVEVKDTTSFLTNKTEYEVNSITVLSIDKKSIDNDVLQILDSNEDYSSTDVLSDNVIYDLITLKRLAKETLSYKLIALINMLENKKASAIVVVGD